MHLEKVRIIDFKSIKSLSVNLQNLTCFVGKNESGKSSILQAISFLNFSRYKFTEDLINRNSPKYHVDGYPTVIGYYLLNDNDRTKLEELINYRFDEKNRAIPNEFGFKYIRVTVNGTKPADVEIEGQYSNNRIYSFEDHFTEPTPKGTSSKLQQLMNLEFLPRIELFSNEEFNLNPVTYQELAQETTDTLSFRRLFQVAGIDDISRLNDPKVERLNSKLYSVNRIITKLLQTNYNQDDSLKVQINIVKDKFSISFIDDSDNSYTLAERSSGFIYFFSFLINKTYQHKLHNLKTVFLLDEPGTSLHPKGARDLIKIFENIANKDQIVYTTHNPFLTFRNNPDGLQLAIREGVGGTTLVTKTYQNKYQLLRRELGLLLNDSFLINDINLVVEGNSDKYMIDYLSNENPALEKLKWVHVFSADTATEIIPSVRYLESLGLKGFVIMDSDKEAQNQIKLPKFKKYILEKSNWNYCTLNVAYGNDEISRSIEDIFPPEQYHNAYNEYYSQEKDTINWDEPFKKSRKTTFSDSGILEVIKVHHKKFDKSGSLNKIAIFRKFVQLYPYSEFSDYYGNLQTILIHAIDNMEKYTEL